MRDVPVVECISIAALLFLSLSCANVPERTAPVQGQTAQKHEGIRALEYKVTWTMHDSMPVFSYERASLAPSMPGFPLYDLDAVTGEEVQEAVSAMHQSQEIYTYIEAYADDPGSTEELTHALAIDLYQRGVPIERIKRREKVAAGDRDYMYVALVATKIDW